MHFAETRHGKTGKYSLACSGGPGARANSHLDVALGNKSPHMHWVALIAPWRKVGGETCK